MVDEEGLVFQPVAPTILADLIVHPFSHRVPKRGFLELGSVFLTATAKNGIHGYLHQEMGKGLGRER